MMPPPSADEPGTTGPRSRAGRGLPWRTALRVGAILAMAWGTWYSLRGLQLAALGQAIGRAQPGWLLLGAITNFGNMGFKALGWRLLLPPEHRVSQGALFRYTVAAGALNVVMPLKAGEAVRIWRLRTHDGVPTSALLTVAGIEKVLDVVSLLLLISPLPWLLPDLPRWVLRALGSCTAATVAGLVVLGCVALLQPRIGGPRVAAAVRQARALGPRLPLGLLVVALSWCVDWALIMLVLTALSLPLAPAYGLLVLFVLNLAIAIPSTPGQMGVLELGASTGLQALHVPQDQALAFGLLYHAAQVLPLLLYLALDWRFVWEVLGGMRASRGAGAPKAAR